MNPKGAVIISRLGHVFNIPYTLPFDGEKLSHHLVNVMEFRARQERRGVK